MATKNFFVQNGLTVGNFQVDASTSNVSTPGTIISSSTQVSVSTITGALRIVGGAGIGGDLFVGGTINGIFNGIITGIVTTASNANTVATISTTANAAYYPTFVNANPASSTYLSHYTTSSFSINPSARSVSVAGDLSVGNTATIGTVLITNTTTNATSTTTGALVVAGGVGIAGDIFVGGNARLTGIFTAGFGMMTISGSSGTFGAQGGAFSSLYNFGSGVATAGATKTINIATGATAGSTTTVAIGPALGTGTVTFQTGTTVQINNTTDAASTTTGALVVKGGVGVGGTVTAPLFVGNLTGTASTATSAAVAYSLANTSTTYVGRAVLADTATTATSAAVAYSWLGGTVINPVTFGNTVTFNGTATYVYSTNTFYTDNLIELHTPPVAGGPTWTVDDGKDIGLRFRYFTAGAGDLSGALVLANDTKYLEWYSTGTEDVSGVFTGTQSYGTFKTGAIFLTNTTTSASTNSGALQVAGGVGIGGNLYVGGNYIAAQNITQASLYANSGGPKLLFGTIAAPTTYMTIGAYAGANQIENNNRPFAINFAGGFGANAVQISAAGVVSINALIAASSTNTGALQVKGGVGIGGDLYVGGTINGTFAGTVTSVVTIASNASNLEIVAQTANAAYYPTFVNSNPATSVYLPQFTTSSFSINPSTGGVGIGGNLYVGGNFTATTVNVGNTTIASYTSGSITSNALVNLDTFAIATYRTARYLWQIVDSTKIHVTEMTVFHDGTTAFKNEYGLITSLGELGTFDAIVGGGNVTITFTPNYTPTAMVIKGNRTIITL